MTDISEAKAEVGKSQVGAELTLQVRRDQQNLKVLARLSVNPNSDQ
ncbi:hypothetical protein OGM63_13100 [Plectonema radiosum NIES-515]|uniref:Uncharacterized protein n=1 Tax=Plectonema radiosum NIES-515 TaxID=2986073 RepID=A0ABT3AZ80_9CYAN|nr:hypothetical protein [Plectonema radiosum]MCV3214438.1 hypothetical protein [Plectonema radiosum NIES-515]